VFGIRGNPRVFSWGNPGVPESKASRNSTLAVGRRSEGGTFQRAFVPVSTSSTTEPVVDAIRLPPDERAKECFVSLDTGLNQNVGNPVLAVDANGDLWSWSYPEPLAGYRLDRVFYYTRPVQVVAQDERAANTRLHKWKKVVADGFGSPSNFVALTTNGTLYGAGSVQSLLLDSITATSSYSYGLKQISTQTWHDVTLFGGAIAAIRSDRTLWVRMGFNNGLSGINENQNMQVRGCIESCVPASQWTHSTSNAQSISFTFSPPPAGGAQAFARGHVRTNDSGVSEVFLRFVHLGWGYTSAPTVTVSGYNSNYPPPQYTARLIDDYNWDSVDHVDGHSLVAMQRANGTTKLFVHTSVNPNLLATNGLTDRGNEPRGPLYIKRASGGFVPGPAALDNLASAVGSKGRAADSGQVFCVCNSTHSNSSNVLSWGENNYGQLAIGTTSTATTDTVNLVPSPDAHPFVALKVAAGGYHTLAVRQGPEERPNHPGELATELMTCGRHQFSGNTTATASITTFSPCSGAMAGSGQYRWENVFAFCHGYDTTKPEQLSFACASTVTESVLN